MRFENTLGAANWANSGFRSELFAEDIHRRVRRDRRAKKFTCHRFTRIENIKSSTGPVTPLKTKGVFLCDLCVLGGEMGFHGVI